MIMIDLTIGNNVLKDIDLMIFDKDGTLFELYPYCSKMVFQRTEAILKMLKNNDPKLKDWLIHQMGVDLENHKIYPQGPIGVYSKYYAMDMLFDKINAYGYKITADMLKEAFSEADHNINDINYLKESLVPVRGMIEFIEQTSDKCTCAIYSNDMTNRLKKTLDIFNIKNYFDYVLGGDLVEKHKPNPMGLLKILEELNISPENTAFFGDSALDIESGQKAKCKYLVGVLSDISDLNYLKSNSNAIIKDFTHKNIIYS
jgi:HAD superfamily hydrolase (TIGR01509 family)